MHLLSGEEVVMAYVHEFGIIDCIEENIDCKSEELEILINKISDAIKEDKWLLHYGI